MSSGRFTPYIKKSITIVIIVLLFILLRNRIMVFFSTLGRTNILSTLEEEFSSKKQENVYLREKLIIAKTDYFVEEEARTKLGMVREGEKIVGDRKIEPKEMKAEKPELQNWQKWQKLFF